MDSCGLTEPRGWLPGAGSLGIEVIQGFTSSHDAWQTNGFFVYTGAALPDPAVVVVQRRFLPHLLEDLLSLQLSPRWALVLLEAPLGRTSLPDAV